VVRREPDVHSIALSPDLGEVSHARRFISAVAAAAGFREERVFDIMVACGEAIANAIEHSPEKGEIEVRTIVHRDRLEVEVEGPGEFQAPDRMKERTNRGMGLPLMARLSDHLALYSGPRGGTLVALTFYLPGAQVDEGITPPWITEILEKNELVAGITESVPVGLYIVDPDLRYRWANAAYQAFLEEPYRSQPLEGVFVGDTLPGSDPQTGPGLQLLRLASQTGNGMFFPEHDYQGFSRGTTYWRRELIPLKRERIEPPYDVLVVVSETTEQVLQQKELESASRSYQALAENSGLALAARCSTKRAMRWISSTSR
jgi:anti-sigma regulatory factor (Ser/Thr protein kinase)